MCFLLIVFGCELTDDNEYRIDPELKPYVERFYDEAQKRGIYLDKANLTVVLEHNIACNTEPCIGTSNSKKRYVAISKWFYEKEVSRNPSFGEQGIEFAVFHEMGHAVLYRSHTSGFAIMDCCGTAIRSYSRDAHLRVRLLNEFFQKDI